MISVITGADVGGINVFTSDEGGHTSEQIVDLAMDKIMTVSDSAPPAIKDQAQAFQNNLRHLLFQYVELARREERATIVHRLQKAGNSEIADLVRRI